MLVTNTWFVVFPPQSQRGGGDGGPLGCVPGANKKELSEPFPVIVTIFIMRLNN